MSRFDSIVLPLDGSAESAKAVECALWLADALRATLHVVHSAPRPLAATDALERLRAPAAERARTVLHQTSHDPVEAVLEQTVEQDANLVVLSARGQSASAGVEPERQLGRIARALLLESNVPIVLVPVHYRELLPWRSMLVAASGEPAADEALATAVRLASALELRVTVVHIAEGPAPLVLGRYADAFQHELAFRLEELVSRGLLRSPPEERGCIEAVALRSGDPVAEILAEVDRHRSSVLALGWHGSLDAARARVLHGLLEWAECPLLVVRESPRSHLRLRVGDAISDEAAR